MDESFEIYPIPALRQVNIKYETGQQNEHYTISIQNMLGQQVWFEQVESSALANVYSVELSNLKRGQYIISIANQNSRVNKMITKL